VADTQRCGCGRTPAGAGEPTRTTPFTLSTAPPGDATYARARRVARAPPGDATYARARRVARAPAIAVTAAGRPPSSTVTNSWCPAPTHVACCQSSSENSPVSNVAGGHVLLRGPACARKWHAAKRQIMSTHAATTKDGTAHVVRLLAPRGSTNTPSCCTAWFNQHVRQDDAPERQEIGAACATYRATVKVWRLPAVLGCPPSHPLEARATGEDVGADHSSPRGLVRREVVH
jgi:hypothetical protein